MPKSAKGHFGMFPYVCGIPFVIYNEQQHIIK